jgi:hypothetical protein
MPDLATLLLHKSGAGFRMILPGIMAVAVSVVLLGIPAPFAETYAHFQDLVALTWAGVMLGVAVHVAHRQTLHGFLNDLVVHQVLRKARDLWKQKEGRGWTWPLFLFGIHPGDDRILTGKFTRWGTRPGGIGQGLREWASGIHLLYGIAVSFFIIWCLGKAGALAINKPAGMASVLGLAIVTYAVGFYGDVRQTWAEIVSEESSGTDNAK